MSSVTMYLLSTAVIVTGMVILASLTYWFGRTNPLEPQITSEHHDHPKAKNRIIVLPRKYHEQSVEFQLGINLSEQSNTELLFVDIHSTEDSQKISDLKKQLEALCEKAREHPVKTGYVLAKGDSYSNELNQILTDYHAEAVIRGWEQEQSNTANKTKGNGFLDSLIDSCSVPLILVEDTFDLSASNLLLTSLDDEFVSFTLGIASSMYESESSPNVQIIQKHGRTKDKPEEKRLQSHIRSMSHSPGRIRGKWPKTKMSAEVNFIPDGLFFKRIPELSQKFDGIIMEISSKNFETGRMFSSLIDKTDCPIILTRPSLNRFNYGLTPLFQT